MKQGSVTLERDTDRLIVEFPSGAGTHAPEDRDPELVRRDVRNGLVTPHRARQDYGVEPEPQD